MDLKFKVTSYKKKVSSDVKYNDLEVCFLGLQNCLKVLEKTNEEKFNKKQHKKTIKKNEIKVRNKTKFNITD